MSDDSKPYRSGASIKTGDRVAFVCGDQRIEGTAQVESGPLAREQNIRIIPDGEPWKYGRDYAFAPNPSDEALTHSQIIHRRIYTRLHELGVLPVYPLPDSPFDEEASNAGRGGIIQGGKLPAWMVDTGLVESEPETPQQRALPRPSTTPPPWADNPAGQRRPTKTRNHRRVK